MAGVGPHYFEDDRFGAVSDALLPVLADRMSFQESKSKSDVWQAAFDPKVHKGKLTGIEVAKLNRLVHIAFPPEDSRGDERGAVIALPEWYTGGQFQKEFAIEEADAASSEFFCHSIFPRDPRVLWVLGAVTTCVRLCT